MRGTNLASSLSPISWVLVGSSTPTFPRRGGDHRQSCVEPALRRLATRPRETVTERAEPVRADRSQSETPEAIVKYPNATYDPRVGPESGGGVAGRRRAAAASRVLRCLPLAILAASLLVASGPASAQTSVTDLAVIVHPSTIEDDVSLADLRSLFRGEQLAWPEGARVVLFVQPAGTAEGDAVLREIYRMTEAEYRQYWITKVFREKLGTGPKVVSSPAMARRLTAAVPGAVAVVPATEVDGTVKVLSVDHRLPGAGAYPLRVAKR